MSDDGREATEPAPWGDDPDPREQMREWFRNSQSPDWETCPQCRGIRKPCAMCRGYRLVRKFRSDATI